MDFKSYTDIYFAITFAPPVVVLITGFFIWKYWKKSELLMLFIMNGIISKKNINKKTTFFVCNKKLDPSTSQDHFMLISLLIIAICIQCFFAFAIVEVVYECSHNPDLDCFIKDNDGTFGYNNSPVNCSTITQDDIVICYRIPAFGSDRTLIGIGAAHLVFKMLNFVFTIIAYAMLLVAEKVKKEKTLVFIKQIFNILLLVVIIVPVLLSTFVDEVESVFRKVSYPALVQWSLFAILTGYFLARLPWEKFVDSKDYFVDASLPDDVEAIEMS